METIASLSQSYPTVFQLVAVYGAWKLAGTVWWILNSMRHYLLTSNDLSKYKNGKKDGSIWAVVTGASGGIGASIARGLAKRGFSVILMARTVSKMEELAADLKKINSSIDVKVVAFDFEKATDQDYIVFELSYVNQHDIRVLVNNVGFGNPEGFVWTEGHSWATMRKMLTINMTAPSRMTRIFLPRFKKLSRSSSQSTLILNLSSQATHLDAPYVTTYAATKAFNKKYSDMLQCEMMAGGYKVDVQSVTPGLVDTNMPSEEIKKELGPIGMLNSDVYGEAVLNRVGDGYTTSGHWYHGALGTVFKAIPRSLTAKLTKKPAEPVM